MRRFWVRSGIILLIIIAYFLLLRPLRGVINETFFHPFIAVIVNSGPSLHFDAGASSVTNNILFQGASGIQSVMIKVPFGLFFLLACIGLVAIGADRKLLVYLVLIQVATGVISLVFLALSNLISLQMITMTDFTVRYLNPLCTLGLVPLAFTLKKRAVNEP